MTLLLSILPGAAARHAIAGKEYKLAQQAEDRSDYERALELYLQASAGDPANPAIRMAVRRMRFQVGQAHFGAGKELLDKGSFAAALVEFRKAFAVDRSNTLAMQEIQRATEMLDHPLKPDEQKQNIERIASMLPLPQLNPIVTRISTLKMNNQPPRVLYETVGRIAGINVIFDPVMQTPPKNVNLEIADSTPREALDYLAALTRTYWKPMTANTIFVTEDNPLKRRDYEDQVVKVFYLRNCTSVQEFQETVNAVRSVTNMVHMFTTNALNAVVARGTADQMALAEKLFHDLDQAKAEVVVDVIVMETNTVRTREIAMGLVSNGAAGLSLPIGFSPRGATSGSSTISLGQAGKTSFSDFSVTLPGALLEAVMSDNTTRIMQSPQVRVSDGQKVTLKIGERVPYATGSYQAGVSAATVSPLVSTQFNFVETGVLLEVTPHVHGSDEVTLHISVDVSSVSQKVTIGGIEEPQIAQHKEETDIRVRNGEVNLLGGLTQLQDIKTFAGIPGLVNVPGIGRMFGDNSRSRTRGELLIALIPHIVRTLDITALNTREIGSGTEAVIKLNLPDRSK